MPCIACNLAALRVQTCTALNTSMLTPPHSPPPLEPPRTAYNERHRLQVKHAGLECASAETIGEIACTTHSHVRLFRPLGPRALLHHYSTHAYAASVSSNRLSNQPTPPYFCDMRTHKNKSYMATPHTHKLPCLVSSLNLIFLHLYK